MQNYSVLMSVYHKEKAKYLKTAMQSMFDQTVPTNDFVLVCDGPLTDELDSVIDEMYALHPNVLNIVKLPKNGGLGNALNEGLKFCKNELVARMDSDDISFPDRCERQLDLFDKMPELSIVSGTVSEFSDDSEFPVGSRALPSDHDDILKFSKTRCPFNHPAVMFKASAVEKAGGYNQDFPYFEDYYLWIRMLQNGVIGMNIDEPLVNMRVSNGLYDRRGGKQYLRYMTAFRKWLRKIGYINGFQYCFSVSAHSIISLAPKIVRGKFYKVMHN